MSSLPLTTVCRELYESACVAKHWSLVRHTHGLLGRRIQNMDLSCTDLVVRQKQVNIRTNYLVDIMSSNVPRSLSACRPTTR